MAQESNPTSQAVEEGQRDITPTSHIPNPQYILDAEPKSAIGERPRIMFYSRLAAFFVIEAGFIGLAATCLVKPVTLDIPIKFTDSEVKGGFIIVFILWQCLAIVAGAHILAGAFTRQQRLTGPDLAPADPPGLLGAILYFFMKQVRSGTFKLAFTASLSFVALILLAAGMISISTTFIELPTTIKIGNLASVIDGPDWLDSTLNRASMIVSSE